MPDIYMRKVGTNTFVCTDDVSREYAAKIKLGEDLKFKFSKPRNLKFHKKFFAMLNLVLQNQDRIDYSTTEQGLDRLLFAVMYVLKRGTFWGRNKEHFERASISFANMGEIEFGQLYTETLDVCLKHFCPMDKEDFERELLGFG